MISRLGVSFILSSRGLPACCPSAQPLLHEFPACTEGYALLSFFLPQACLDLQQSCIFPPQVLNHKSFSTAEGPCPSPPASLHLPFHSWAQRLWNQILFLLQIDSLHSLVNGGHPRPQTPRLRYWCRPLHPVTRPVEASPMLSQSPLQWALPTTAPWALARRRHQLNMGASLKGLTRGAQLRTRPEWASSVYPKDESKVWSRMEARGLNWNWPAH